MVENFIDAFKPKWNEILWNSQVGILKYLHMALYILLTNGIAQANDVTVR